MNYLATHILLIYNSLSLRLYLLHPVCVRLHATAGILHARHSIVLLLSLTRQ